MTFLKKCKLYLFKKNKMIKVVHISTSKHGGAGIAAYRLHEALNKSGEVESYFIHKDFNKNNSPEKTAGVPFYTPSIFFRILRKLKLTDFPENNKLRKYVQKFSSKFEIATYPESLYRIEEHPLVKEADIVHLHWVANFLNYPTFFKKIQKPIIWTLHDMNPFQGLFHYKNDEMNLEKELGNIDNKILKKKVKSIRKNRNINIITLCNWMHDCSINSKAFRNFRHTIIPNLIDFENYPLLNREQEKRKHNLDNGLKTLMFIAQDINNKRKGFDLLLKALNLITQKANIITVGGDKISLNSNFNHLHFKKIEHIPDLNSLYSASDLVLLTSREDNLPNVMLESFANGTPVISFKVGGMKDWIKENETGYLIQPFSTEKLSEKITYFLDNKNNFDSNKIYEYAKENFSIEKKLPDYIYLYKQVSAQ